MKSTVITGLIIGTTLGIASVAAQRIFAKMSSDSLNNTLLKAVEHDQQTNDADSTTPTK